VLRLDARSSLRSLFTLPVVVLVLLSTVTAGVLSYRSAAQVADDNVRRWLSAGVRSIGQTLDSQQALVDASLRAAMADGSPLLEDLGQDIEGLRQQLWAAVQLHPEERAPLRLVTARGQSATLQRMSTWDAELVLQLGPNEPATAYLFRGADGALQARPASALPPPQGDPRAAEWVRQTLAQNQALWLPARTDPSGTLLQAPRARPVLGADGRVQAALATTVSLAGIQEALRRMPMPAGGEAVIVERDGLLVASSAGPLWRRSPEASNQQRLSVTDASLPLMSAVYPRLLPQLARHGLDAPGSDTLELPGLSTVVASWARLSDGAGRDWVIVVATPRASLTQPLLRTIAHTVALGLVAAALVLLLAAVAQRRLLRDAQGLSQALRRMGEGDLETPPAVMVSPELAALRDELRRTQLRLRAERQSGLANREAVLNRLHERMRPGRRHNDAPLLAVLFIDLDRFANLNERHGREAGDFVLQAIGRRLRQTVRDTDLVARWSGDEFVVLLDGVGTPEHAERVRDQVERVLRDPVELGPQRDAAEPDGTVGLALSPRDGQDPDALLRAAQEDMAARKPQPAPVLTEHRGDEAADTPPGLAPLPTEPDAPPPEPEPAPAAPPADPEAADRPEAQPPARAPGPDS
jgi:diguanylate cyclase (GGDEF)-like protein